MLIDQSWTPGVWIDGQASTLTDDPMTNFAHQVHDDLVAARTAGRLPAHIEITVSLAHVEAQDATPAGTLISVRLQPTLADPAVRQSLKREAISTMDRLAVEHIPPDRYHQYAGFVFLVDEQHQPTDYSPHSLGF
ncbi:hypothetical protein [Saccharothrix sp.]|uniref:hypothetical protein n=1 Tax=Saccharothrix sp. TaxID=1873460 RepID=UPI0028113337|nr:hypothetical protein [Saccharothrix sp.]